jgi:hypothetical protein
LFVYLIVFSADLTSASFSIACYISNFTMKKFAGLICLLLGTYFIFGYEFSWLNRYHCFNADKRWMIQYILILLFICLNSISHLYVSSKGCSIGHVFRLLDPMVSWYFSSYRLSMLAVSSIFVLYAGYWPENTHGFVQDVKQRCFW